MGDLKIENARLQKLADILDSQPELTFCIDKTGRIKYISDSAVNCMKSSVPDDSDEDPWHINQIFTLESVETILEIVSEVRGCASRHKSPQEDHNSCVSSVQVCVSMTKKFLFSFYVLIYLYSWPVFFLIFMSLFYF